MAVAYQPMKAARTLGGLDIPLESLPEGASKTFKAGAVVVYSSGGISEASNDPSTAVIVGVACQDGQNLSSLGVANTPPPYTSPNTLVALAMPGVIFEANCDDTTQTLALTQAMVGGQFSIEKDGSSGLWFIDQSDAGNKVVTIVALKDAVGTVNGRVYFVFRNAITIFG